MNRASTQLEQPNVRGESRVRDMARNTVALGVLSVSAFLGGKTSAEHFGSVEGKVCPITVKVSHDVFDFQRTPSVAGSTVESAWVEIPDAHDNPFLKTRGTVIDVDESGITDVRELIDNGTKERVKAFERRCSEDAESLLRESAGATLLAGTVGGLVGSLAGWGALNASRRARNKLGLSEKRAGLLIAAPALAVGALTLSSLTWARFTLDENALQNPVYQGYFADLENTIDLSQLSLEGYQEQGREFTRWIDQVAQLQEGLANPEQAPDYITILSIADIHSRPCAYERVQVLAKAFDVDFITNAGDEREWDERESGLLTPVGSCDGIDTPEDVNYEILQVEGNHDDDEVMKNLDAMANVTVLDNEIITMRYEKADGSDETVRILGIADDRFEGDDTLEGQDEPKRNLLKRLSEEEVLSIARGDYDILLVHDPQLIYELHEANILPESVKLISTGHRHKNKVDRESTNAPLLVTGSSGGAGLRAFTGVGYPSEYSVVYLDPDTKEVARISLISVTNEGEITIRNVNLSEN